MKNSEDGCKIVLFGSAKGWHARRLVRAFKARGIIPIVTLLDGCHFSTACRSGLDIPGLEGAAPAAAFVRMMPPGSFEEVTFYLGLLHGLEALGIPVWNNAAAIERCTDKSTTTFLLGQAGLKTPVTWVGNDFERAKAWAREAQKEQRLLVQKPLFGSQGRGLKLIRTVDDLSENEQFGGVYYLQDYVAPYRERYHDWRLFVCRGRVIAAMMRHGENWITNMRQGAHAEAALPSKDLSDIAIRATQATGAAYAGVDILQSREGQFLVLEVNSMPAWMALERVCGVDIADHLIASFLKSLPENISSELKAEDGR